MDSSQQKYYPVIPQGNLKCVWMSAGILSYQLCDRLFECDSCPFDQAMRKHFVESTEQRQKMYVTPSGGLLQDECSYTPQHSWVKEVSSNCFRVGIEPGLATVLPAPKAIVLPLVGQRFKMNKVAAWIIYDEGIFPLYSPADGEAVTVHTSINEHPQDLLEHPSEHGWLYEIKPDLPLPPTLMNRFDASRRFKQDQDHLKDLLLVETHRVDSHVGVSLSDGGQPVRNASEMIGQKRYLQLLLEVFGKL